MRLGVGMETSGEILDREALCWRQSRVFQVHTYASYVRFLPVNQPQRRPARTSRMCRSPTS